MVNCKHLIVEKDVWESVGKHFQLIQ